MSHSCKSQDLKASLFEWKKIVENVQGNISKHVKALAAGAWTWQRYSRDVSPIFFSLPPIIDFLDDFSQVTLMTQLPLSSVKEMETHLLDKARQDLLLM